jgi:hypothetical protein
MEDEKLVVYYEVEKPDIEDDRITYIDLFSVSGVGEFFDLIMESHPVFRGVVTSNWQTGETVSDFRYDAFRFARKVYAFTDAGISLKGEKFAWLDADIVFHGDVPENYLDSLIPDNIYTTYIGRDWLYSENGFIGFNSAHEWHSGFMQLLRNTYATGAFRMLGEWHDCYVYDFVRQAMNVPSRNLAEGLPKMDHPFVNTELGLYMDHLKGPKRKTTGKSDLHDAIIDHKTPYWRPNLFPAGGTVNE